MARTYDILNAGSKNRFMANGRIVSNSGRNIQLQNLPKNYINSLADAREMLKMGCFDALDFCYGNTSDILSQLIRTMLIPKPGYEFIICDFSAVEARVLAWLAGEDWRLEAFERGEDIYCASASAMFKKPVVKNGVNGELRAKGKIAELACLSFDSLVLTNQGMVPIQDVTKEMKLWDGEEWVKHEGVVYRGEKEVITYDGLTATPEHLVWVEGKSKPIRFKDAATAGCKLVQTGVDWRAVRLSEDYLGRVNLSEEKLDKICSKQIRSDILALCQGRGYKETLSGADSGRNYQGCGNGKVRVYDIRNAGRHHRFTVSGKLVHNCGYGGSSGALAHMGALEMGLTEDELKDLVADWRKANLNIVKFWWKLESAAKDAFYGVDMGEGKRIRQESTVGKIDVGYSKGILFLTLPSGRSLTYMNPKITTNSFGGESISYKGLNAANKWVDVETYGGKLAENCIAEGTLVATSRGFIPIEDIRDTDLIFDGIEFVHHEGIVFKGIKPVIRVVSLNDPKGIELTPEHKILTSQGWRKACESRDWDDGDAITIQNESKEKPVYDILNCGARHRFAVGEKFHIVSNCTQATSRDLLAEAMWRMEQKGLDIVSHIHDEVVLEVPKNSITVDEVREIMNGLPDWAEGLPIDSSGYKGNFYFKD